MSTKKVINNHIKRNPLFSTILIYVFVGILGFLCIAPFIMMLGSSFAPEEEIRKEGYKLIPNNWTLEAYRMVFVFPEKILTGYKNTIITTILGTILHLAVCTLAAYPLSVRQVKYRQVAQTYILITMVLNGGMVSWYMICTQMLGLKNSLLSLIMPMLVSPFNVYLIRNYFMGLPEAMRESGMVDGASQLRIFFQIMLPLATPVLATVALFISITYWNDWFNSLMLNDKPAYFSLQLVLKSIISQIQFMTTNSAAAGYKDVLDNLPSETIKLATAVLTTGPIILLYPFIQKYFVKGITIGAVKG